MFQDCGCDFLDAGVGDGRGFLEGVDCAAGGEGLEVGICVCGGRHGEVV